MSAARSRTVVFGELVGRGGKIDGTFEVKVEREATLTPDLADIESRKLRGVRLVIHPGFDDARVVRLDRDDLVALRDGLDAALTSTRDEDWS